MSAAAAAAVQAAKASGIVVRVQPADFTRLLHKQREALVVHTRGRFFSRAHRYLMSYKGLVFWTKTPEPLHLPSGTELVEVESLWMPG